MKHALVVGGTRGIGAVIAKKFTAPGTVVSIVGRMTLTYHQLIDYHHGLHDLIICQRYRGEGNVWTGEIETSLTLTKQIIEGCIRHCEIFTEPISSIVILSSLISQTVANEQPVGYHACKAALEAMARFYAVDLGGYGTRVNCISLGVVLKEENKTYYDDHPEKVALFKRITPLGRMGTAQDVANAVWLLCQPEAGWITGQTIVCDGGVSLLNQEALARSFLPKEGEK